MSNIKVELKGLDKVLAVMHPKVYRKALSRTLNELGSGIKTSTVKEVRETYNVKASGLKKKLKTKNSSDSNLKWTMEVPADSRINLINFGARKVKTGVSIKIMKSGDRKVVKGAFIANKGKTVFQRKTKNRLPIKTVTTMSPSQMISSRLKDRKIDDAKKKAQGKFQHNFDHLISNL